MGSNIFFVIDRTFLTLDESKQYQTDVGRL